MLLAVPLLFLFFTAGNLYLGRGRLGYLRRPAIFQHEIQQENVNSHSNTTTVKDVSPPKATSPAIAVTDGQYFDIRKALKH